MVAVEKLELQNSMEKNCKPFRSKFFKEGSSPWGLIKLLFLRGYVGGGGVD